MSLSLKVLLCYSKQETFVATMDPLYLKDCKIRTRLNTEFANLAQKQDVSSMVTVSIVKEGQRQITRPFRSCISFYTC
jgi:hypothetical protein